MRCSTWRGNDLTKLNRQVQLWVCPRFEPPTPHLCMISYTGREPVFLLSFIPSASCRCNSFTILSPSPVRGVETPQQVQATSDRSRISTKACSPITCVTGCATKSQLSYKSDPPLLSIGSVSSVTLFLAPNGAAFAPVVGRPVAAVAPEEGPLALFRSIVSMAEGSFLVTSLIQPGVPSGCPCIFWTYFLPRSVLPQLDI